MTDGVCHSYATRCQARVGKSLVPDESVDSTTYSFEIPGTDALYFTYLVGYCLNVFISYTYSFSFRVMLCSAT